MTLVNYTLAGLLGTFIAMGIFAAEQALSSQVAQPPQTQTADI